MDMTISLSPERVKKLVVPLWETAMVSSVNKEHVGRSSSNTTTEQQSAILAIQNRETASPTQETSTGCLPLIRKSLQSLGFSEPATNIITHSWRGGTQKQYKTYLKGFNSVVNGKLIQFHQLSIPSLSF
jgi:hypothetical protein